MHGVVYPHTYLSVARINAPHIMIHCQDVYWHAPDGTAFRSTVAVKKYLMKENALCAEACLDMMVQLARDLQVDFYPLFQEFFQVDYLNIKKSVYAIQAHFTQPMFVFCKAYMHLDRGGEGCRGGGLQNYL